VRIESAQLGRGPCGVSSAFRWLEGPTRGWRWWACPTRAKATGKPSSSTGCALRMPVHGGT